MEGYKGIIEAATYYLKPQNLIRKQGCRLDKMIITLGTHFQYVCLEFMSRYLGDNSNQDRGRVAGAPRIALTEVNDAANLVTSTLPNAQLVSH